MTTAAQSQLDVIIKGEDQLSPELSKLESRIIRAVGAISASLAAIKIGAAPITAAAQFERELANVAKTTNFTAQQVSELSDALLKVSLRTDVSALDLAKIAAAAGQQGLGKQGVEGVASFTESVSRMASVLDITAQEAATDVGKILNVFHLSMQETEKVVSTFNQVSNNSTASGKELLDVVRRIGDASGTIKLEGATALAAAAIDFGSSPEVAGTALSTTFAKMFQNAKELGRLMGMSAQDWIKTLQTDGIAGFKALLARLRELEPQSQIDTITKLLGGGRQGALIQKFVRDTSNAVLDKELQNAEQGSQSGTSALREQATVMKALSSQFDILKNSIFKLGVDSGEQLLRPLAIYTSEIAKAIQSPAIQSFARALVGSFGDVLQLIAKVVTGLGAMNVNWENFLKVVQVFIGLKLAQTFLSLSTSIPGIGAALKFVQGSAVGTANAMKAAGDASAEAANIQAASQNKVIEALKRMTGYYSELGVLIRAHNADVKEQAALEAQLAERQNALAAKSAQADVARGAVNRGNIQLNNAGQDVAQRARALQDAEQNAANAAQAVTAQRQAREAAQAQAHNARLLAIEADYQTEKAAIGGSRNSKAQVELRALRDKQIADEEASNARSLRGIETYYSNRLRTVQAAAQAEVDAQRAIYAKANTNFDTILAAQQKKADDLSKANAAVTTAQGLVNATQGKISADSGAAKTFDAGPVTLYQRAVNAASVAMRGAATIGTVLAATIRTIGAALSVVARLATGAFFWVTILFSIADALGIVDSLGQGFQKLTDAIGLTSKAMRDAKAQQELNKKAAEDHAKAIQDLIDKYAALKDINTGTISQDFVQKQVKVLGSPDATLEAKQQAIQALLTAARGAQAELEKVGQNGEKIDASFQAQLQAQQKKLEDARSAIARISAELASTPAPVLNVDSIGDQGQNTARLTTELEAAKKAASDAATAIAGMKTGLSDTSTLAKQANESLLNIAQGMAQVLTQTGNDQFKAQAQGLLDAAKAYADAKTAAATIAADPKLAGTEEGAARQKEALDNVTRTQTALANAQQAVRNLEKQFGDMKGVPPETLKSLRDLVFFASLGESQITALAGIIDVINKNGIKPTGQLAGNLNPTGQSSGDGKFKPSNNADSEARKEARARMQLAQAEAQAAINLEEERNKQILSNDKFSYDRGLTAIKDYYDTRQKVQLTSLDNEIKIKQGELAQAQQELKGADQKAEQIRFQAEVVKINGQIKVLQERKKGVEDDRKHEEFLANDAFNKRVLAQGNALAESLVIPRSISENQKAMYQELLDQYDVFLNQLEKNGHKPLADSLRAGFAVDSLSRALNPIKTQLDIAFGQIDRYRQSVENLAATGTLTSQQAEAALTAAIQQQMPILQDRLNLMKQELATVDQLAQPEKYAQIAGSIDEIRLRMAQLNAETNKTARDINTQITNNLGDALGNLEPTFQSLRDTAIGFLRDIAKEAQKVLGKDLAEQFFQWVNGGDNAGGIGGFIQSIMQGGAPGIPAGKAASQGANAVQNALGQGWGQSPALALYVRTADAFPLDSTLAGKQPTADQQQSLDDLITQLQGQDAASQAAQADTVSQLSDTLSTEFDSLTSDLGGIFDNLTGSLGDLFGGFGDTLSGLFSGSSDWLTGLMGIFGMAHSGGVIGRSRLDSKMVSPAIFRHAIRYHTGGIAGLAPNEVPAILKKGEEVLTQNDPRHRDNTQMAPGAAGVNLRNVLVVDRDFVPGAMQSAQGENVVMSILTKNASTVRRIVKG